MVTLYVGGKRVDWADMGRVFADPSVFGRKLEFRDDDGQVLARVISESPIAKEDDPEWVKAITPEAIEEALKGPFLTLEEYRKQVGQA
ncbi:MAG: hypothetical protein C0467_20090 [Planctomycetaceae bacterium]|nr:hypothetical protein [Planctomycetaceae bacterium]